MVATLGENSANKFVFVVVTILAKIATNGGSSYQAGWLGALERN